MATDADPRYAIYFAPAPESGLWRFGSAWLGYDAATGEAVAQSCPAGWDADAWHAATEEPRRYGFHATLKAPFRLSASHAESDLADGLRRFAAGADSVALGSLVVATIGRFLALVPADPPSALGDLAARVVLAFEPFRAPLSEMDRLRRRPADLTPRQRELLELYGYPHVLEQFRFHMTLGGPLPEDRLSAVAAVTAADVARSGVDAPVTLDRIALFRQASPGERFSIIATAALRG